MSSSVIGASPLRISEEYYSHVARVNLDRIEQCVRRFRIDARNMEKRVDAQSGAKEREYKQIYAFLAEVCIALQHDIFQPLTKKLIEDLHRLDRKICPLGPSILAFASAVKNPSLTEADLNQYLKSLRSIQYQYQETETWERLVDSAQRLRLMIRCENALRQCSFQRESDWAQIDHLCKQWLDKCEALLEIPTIDFSIILAKRSMILEIQKQLEAVSKRPNIEDVIVNMVERYRGCLSKQQKKWVKAQIGGLFSDPGLYSALKGLSEKGFQIFERQWDAYLCVQIQASSGYNLFSAMSVSLEKIREWINDAIDAGGVLQDIDEGFTNIRICDPV